MKKQNFNTSKCHLTSALVAIVLFLTHTGVVAQKSVDGGQLQMDGYMHRVNAVCYYGDCDQHYILDKPKDFTLPNNAQGYLYLRAKGADGGKTYSDLHDAVAGGGGGATIIGHFKIGTGTDMIPPGSTIRMLMGRHGQKRHVCTGCGYDGAGGGGGTGILFKAPNQNEWKLLIVAGGGGGATGRLDPGGPGVTTTNGANGLGSKGGKGGTDGEMGTRDDKGGVGYPGCGLFGPDYDADLEEKRYGSPGWPAARYVAQEATYFSDGSLATPLVYGYDYTQEPLGGKGSSSQTESLWNQKGGGWGFGGAGAGLGNGGGGGGGGYSGGGAGGDGAAGGGGGSYISTMAVNPILIENLRTGDPLDGYVDYMITSSSSFNDYRQIKFAYNTGKCMDDYASHTDNGTNIQTYNCHSAANQWWYFDPRDRSVRSKLNLKKCLDLDQSNQANGTNIQLWDCNFTKAQKWLYNGIHKTIHSGTNSHKCLDATNGSYNRDANVNVQLWDCSYGHPNMRWEVAGAATVSDPAKVKYIVPVIAGGFAVHSHSGAKSGSNMQLWTKDNTNEYEQWYFDGLAIKMRNHQNLCIDLYQSSAWVNGTNIQLYNCNGTNAQQWIYDGLTRTIRSVINPKKCMQFEKNSGGEYGKYSNVRIWDCNGSDQQQFLIKE